MLTIAPAIRCRGTVKTSWTPRAVCGLSVAEIAAVFLIPEPTMAKRLVRARRKISASGITRVLPSARSLADRLTG